MNKNILLFSLTVLAIVAIPGFSSAESIPLETYTPSRGLSDVIPDYSLSSIIYDAIKKDGLGVYDNSFSVDKEKTIGGNSILVTLPAGLQIYQQDINSDSTMKNISEFIATKKGDAYVVGDSKSHLVFSKPVKLEITTKIPNGTLAKIVVKHEGDLGYNTKGLTNNPDTSCNEGVSSSENSFSIVKNNKIVIYTCGASEFIIDSNFIAPLKANTTVYSIVSQSDDKIIIGGSFTVYNGTLTNRLARLLPNGLIDTGFDIGLGFNQFIQTMDIQSDGKILVGGDYTTYNGLSQNRLIRLNTDGTNDTGFNIGGGFDSYVRIIKILSDGKIAVGGQYTTYNGISQNRLIRLNTDGTKDTGFNIGGGFGGQSIYDIIEQVDGKIVVGGSFTTFSGVSQKYIIRLNSDGTKDTGFNIGGSFDSQIFALGLQSDGKIVAGGGFTNYSGLTQNRITRLNSDGTKDTGFNIGSGFGGATFGVWDLSIQPDGKIVIGGDFRNYSGTTQNRISRLNSNGSIDTGFNIGGGFNSDVNKINIQQNGNIIIGGNFTNFNNGKEEFLIRLNSDGTRDNSIFKGGGLDSSQNAVHIIQPDGKILIGGYIQSYSGVVATGLVRLNSDATLDLSFSAPLSFSGASISALSLQGDGKILVGGLFYTTTGVNLTKVTRLNSDGSTDMTFYSGGVFSAWSQIYGLKIQTDGKIVVGGTFTTYSGTTQNRIMRLNTDGTKDTGFNIGGGFDNTVRTLAIQQDGKIVAGGYFTNYSGVNRSMVIRLNTDGTIDTGFNVGGGFGGFGNNPRDVKIQPDGKIVFGGAFSSYSGISQGGITRLNTDGTRDTGFNIGWGFGGLTVYSLQLLPDGKILAGGDFSMYSGQTINKLARLNTNGTLDASFNMGIGFNSQVTSISYYGSGKIFILGGFLSYSGTSFNRIAQLYILPSKPTIQFPLSGSIISFDGSLGVLGTGESNQEIRIEVGNNIYTGLISSTGVWNFSLTGLLPGTYLLTGKVYDGLGNYSSSVIVPFTAPSPVAGLDTQIFPNTQGVIQGGTGFLSITMTNTGNIGLTGLSVTNIMIPMCDRMIGYLGAGETTGYSCSIFPVNTGFINTTQVIGTGWYGGSEVIGQSISQSINSTVMISPVNIDLNVTMTPSTQTLRFGGWATFTVTVINSGDVDMEGVTVLNSNVGSCNTIIGYLGVNEATQYICSQLVTGSYTNTINVTGYVSTGGFQYPNLIGASQTSVDVVYNPPVVGDGIIEGTEQCEDWNTNNNDGCNSNGQIETPTCVLTGVVSSLQVNVQGVTANGGIFTDIDRGNGLTGVVHSTTLFENNIYAAAGTYNIKGVVESIYSSSITGECMVYNIVATPAVGFGGGGASAGGNNGGGGSTVATQPKPQEIKEIVPIKFIDTSKPETSLVLIGTVQDNVIQQEIVINPEDITTEIRQTKGSQDIPVQVATVNMQSHNTGIQGNTTTQQVVIIPSDTLLTNKYTLVVAAQAYGGVIYGGETAIVPIQVNKLLQEEKNCYTPQNNVAVTLGTGTKQKDQLIYQALLQAYGLTRFTDTDSFKPLNGLKRYEAAKMLVEFARNVLCREKIKIFDNQYNDIATVDPTLKPYIIEAFEFGILKGSNGRFNPLETITKKEFVAAVMRMFTNENMDVEGAGNNWDQEYVTLFNELKLDRELGIGNTIERYDVSKILYKLYHNESYEYREAGYYIPSGNIGDR